MFNRQFQKGEIRVTAPKFKNLGKLELTVTSDDELEPSKQSAAISSESRGEPEASIASSIAIV